ncbi:unnamed protein product [Urochloa decumbens]|uniref:F-box domain-containing protein n=1 Tax=Urochloa decumbens TaxID=240449 RepID=A0ABC8VBU5_9POAL
MFDGIRLQKRSKNEEASTACTGTDRISGLPEGVLHHVLSFLPAHDAVRTCVLARRWRNLWMSAPGIRITGVKGWRDAGKFVAFVDRLLSLRRSSCAPVESCQMKFHGQLIRTPLLDCIPSLETAIVCQKLTHIELSAYPDVFVLNRDLKWCPTFTKLKTLLLNEWSVAADQNALICFLKHSPALEKLTLELYKASQYPVKTDPLELPFASNHLKVEIKCEEVNGTVHKILSSLSTYGIPLNHIKIQQANRSSGSGYVNLVCTGFS